MAATPQYCTLKFTGRSGRGYTKDGYISDVAGAQVNLDGGNGASASSPTTWRPPEDVVLQDVAVVTGTQDTTKIQPVQNSVPTGDFIRYSIHLTTLNNRPLLNIPFRAGSDIAFNQFA